MYRDSTVGVVVPAYNEEGFVGEVIETMPDFIDRVYVVDDRSTDGTWAEIRECAAAANAAWNEGDADADEAARFDPRVVTVRHEDNGGVGAAIKTGYRLAREDGLDAVAVMNGDGQMDPDILPRMLDPVVEGEADYAKGNRLVYPDYREGMSSWRFFGNSVLSFLTKVASGYWQLTDPQNGYTVVSKRALEELDLDALYDDYGFCNHILVKLNAAELPVADVAMPAVYGDEQSSIRYAHFIPTLSWLLLGSFLWRLKRKHVVLGFHPLVVFYGVGALGAGVGAGVLGASAVTALTTSSTGLVAGALGFLILLCSVCSLSGAMLLDMRENAGLEHQRYERCTDDGGLVRDEASDGSVDGDADATNEDAAESGGRASADGDPEPNWTSAASGSR